MKPHSWLTGVLSFILLVAFSATAFAAESSAPGDVRIIVDISGSMKRTDPNNLRLPAVNLLIQMLPDQSQAGIWTFGRYVNNIVPPSEVNKQWRENAKAKAEENINSVGLFTNLTGSLNRASFGVEQDSGYNQSVVLLTDGHIDMQESGMPANTDSQERQRLIQDVLPKYQEAGAKIHTVALSDEVDKDLLQELSAVTGGLYLEAHDGDDLLPVFLKAFDRAIETEQVPLVNNQFQIDTEVKEFTALIFNEDNQPNTRLVAPNGKIYLARNASEDPDTRWYQDRGYELITIKNPAPGEWHAEAKQNPSNRIQVLTDIKLKVSGIPATLYSHQEFEMLAHLLNKDQKITQPEILANSRVTLKVTSPSGKSGSKRLSNAESYPEDGVFKDAFSRLDEEGEYAFELRVETPTFERQRRFTSRLLKPLTVRQEKLVSAEKWLIRVSPNSNIDTTLTRLYVSITAPNGKTETEELSYDEQADAWVTYITESSGPGEYQAQLSGRVVSVGGVTHPFDPNEMQATFPLQMAASAPSTNEQAPSSQGTGIALDLASEFKQQQAENEKEASAGASEEQEEKTQTPEESATDDQAQANNLWLYLSLVIAVLFALLAAVAALVYFKKKQAQAKEAAAETPSEDEEEGEQEKADSKDIPEDLIQQDIEEESQEDLELGEFDDFEGEEEVEIPGGVEKEPADEPASRNTLDDFEDFGDDFDLSSDASPNENPDSEADENTETGTDEDIDDDFALDPPTDKSP